MKSDTRIAALAQEQASLPMALLDHADDLMLVADEQLRLTYVNRSLQRAAAAAATQLLCRTVVEAGLFSAQAPELHGALQRALQTGRSESIDLNWPGKAASRTYEVCIDVVADSTRRHALVRARDVTEQRRVESDLRLREREFRTLAENSPDNIIRYGLDGRAVYCNREIEQRVKVSADSVVGSTASEAAPPGMDGVQAYEEQLARTLATGERGTVELLVPHPNGETRVHSVVIAAERDAGGAVCGAVAVGRDVTEEVRVRRALAAKEREFRTLAENAGDHIVRWDTQARMRYINPAMVRQFGMPIEALLGRTPLEAFPGPHFRPDMVQESVLRVAHEGREAMVELRFTQPTDPREQVHQIHLVPERDEAGRVCSVLGIGRDISEKHAHLELIESLVRTDPLTRLANRQALHERAPGLFAAARRQDRRVGVLLLDLDQFKAINDGMGHTAGDALLCEVARRLTGCLRANDLLVRLGGDEFVAVISDIDNDAVLAAVTAKLHALLAAPLALGRRDIRVTASIGVAVYPNDGEGLEELLAHADAAMYHAKRGGRARTEYYRAELSEAVQRRLLLEESMREACQGAGLELHFQPQVCLESSGRTIGAEALLRWRHPTLGLVMPDAFIALAEETGMIAPIGRWVMRAAAQAAVRFNRGRAEALPIAVNVSTRQFLLDDMAAVIDAVLRETGCSPSWLTVEITESALLEDSPRVRHALRAMGERGVRIAIDDFGTGYSALNYLARFHVDCLKIDKCFVQSIGRAARDDELVKGFIALASALNLATVAEGVETAAQAEFLLAQGCRQAQGYRFGRPMPAAQFELGIACGDTASSEP